MRIEADRYYEERLQRTPHFSAFSSVANIAVLRRKIPKKKLQGNIKKRSDLLSQLL
jgi:hypothetical protein